MPNLPRIQFSTIVLTFLSLTTISLFFRPLAPLASSSHFSGPIPMNMEGRSTISIPANRGILSLKIRTEGTSQVKVADDLRTASQEVMTLLQQHNSPEEGVKGKDPVIELSVNTFSSTSRKKPGFLGEKDVYEAKTDVSATFVAVEVHKPRESLGVKGREWDALSVVLAQVSKMPNVRVESLKWTVDDITKKDLMYRVRTEAMEDAVGRIKAFSKPLLGEQMVVGCKRIDEGFNYRNVEAVVLMDMDREGIRKQGDASEMYDSREDEQRTERFGLEPRVLEVSAAVSGKFEVWKKDGRQGWWRMLLR